MGYSHLTIIGFVVGLHISIYVMGLVNWENFGYCNTMNLKYSFGNVFFMQDRKITKNLKKMSKFTKAH